eukprot:m.45209 g.45209  ORF g.45209 m.45209 type:complete len:256 (-) comp10211_c0_seq2:40-807(-)
MAALKLYLLMLAVTLVLDVVDFHFKKKECADELFGAFPFINFGATTCLKLFVSNWLSIQIMVVAPLSRAPQIVNIFKAKSAEGVSLAAQYLEIFIYSSTAVYNIHHGHAFSTWGESTFQLFQVLLIVSLMLAYSSRYLTLSTIFIAFGFIMYSATAELIPEEIINAAQHIASPARTVSKIFMIYEVYKQKTTGQLSFTSNFANVLGCVVRVFTTLAEVADPAVLFFHIVGLVSNIAVISLFFIYPKSLEVEKKTN